MEQVVLADWRLAGRAARRRTVGAGMRVVLAIWDIVARMCGGVNGGWMVDFVPPSGLIQERVSEELV